MVEGRTYRYNERSGKWKNMVVRGDENGGIYVSVNEGGSGERKSIVFKLTPAEALYFAQVLKMLGKKAIELGVDVSGKRKNNDKIEF